MGFYLNNTPDGTPLRAHGKANDLMAKADARPLIEPPSSFAEIPEGNSLICVFHNGPFDAALLVYDENEMRVATDPTDFRPKSYLLMEKKLAFKLAGIPLEVKP